MATAASACALSAALAATLVCFSVLNAWLLAGWQQLGGLIYTQFACAVVCICRSESKLRSSLAKVPRLDLTPVLAQAEEDQQLEEEQQQQQLQLEQECQEQQLAEEQQHEQQLLLEFSGHAEEQAHRSRARAGANDGERGQYTAATIHNAASYAQHVADRPGSLSACNSSWG